MRVLGLDLGGTNIKWAVLDGDGGVDDAPRPLGYGSLPTGAEGGPDAVAERMLEAGRRAIGVHGDVAAVGVGVPGLFNRDSGAIELFPNLPGPWPGYPLRARLEAGFGRPVTLINDARAFTLAEGTLGAGRGCRTLVCITLGTGVGGGVLIDGRVHLGANGRAGEIGHQVVVEDGPPCGCGNRGCVEPLAWAATLTRLAGRDTAAEVYAGAAEGDEQCRAAIAEVARYLGLGLANVTTVLVPDRIVIGGGISAAGELLLEPLRAVVRARAPLVDPDRIDIVAAALGPEAGAVGAALAALDGSDVATAG
ncbi:MAG TPA: ROK family protein [Candidatus Limnocylindrales bacterium]|nr:ROK family protein [Candidatus Limnocylindrales bacterium]